MPYDKNTLICSDQAITGDAKSENSYDLGMARNVGPGRPLYIVCHVTETFAGGTSLVIEVGTATSADLDTAWKVQLKTRTFLQAELVAGRDPIVIPYSQTHATDQRYLGLNFDDTGEFTDGKITAYVTETPPSNMGD